MWNFFQGVHIKIEAYDLDVDPVTNNKLYDLIDSYESYYYKAPEYGAEPVQLFGTRVSPIPATRWGKLDTEAIMNGNLPKTVEKYFYFVLELYTTWILEFDKIHGLSKRN